MLGEGDIVEYQVEYDPRKGFFPPLLSKTTIKNIKNMRLSRCGVDRVVNMKTLYDCSKASTAIYATVHEEIT